MTPQMKHKCISKYAKAVAQVCDHSNHGTNQKIAWHITPRWAFTDFHLLNKRKSLISFSGANKAFTN